MIPRPTTVFPKAIFCLFEKLNVLLPLCTNGFFTDKIYALFPLNVELPMLGLDESGNYT